MKKQIIIIILCSWITAFAQKVDWQNAPKNPLGFKYKKEHFNLKGDIYASNDMVFDKSGNLIYNFETQYYYDKSGRIIGNNYNDELTYDAKGNINMYKYNSGSANFYNYNDENLLVFDKSAYGDETTYTYDSKNRIIKSTINRKGELYSEYHYSYSKIGDTVVITSNYKFANSPKQYTATYYYLDGYLVKEKLDSVEHNYTILKDSKGNKIDFYTTNKPNENRYKTLSRYYSDINKPIKLELGYYESIYNTKLDKILTTYVNGNQAFDIVISEGVKPNEKVFYDGLTQTYYAVPNVIKENHSIHTRIPLTQILSKGTPYLSYAYDGKFINYVDGFNRVKSREFAFLGPHMVDYRVEKKVGRTYVIKNYQNIKEQEVKEMSLFTTDTTSVLYTRDLVKDNFFIVVKGKHIDYKNARLEYLNNGDPVIFVNNTPMYVLKGFKTATHEAILLGKIYEDELKNQQSNLTKKNTTATTNTAPTETCISGNCTNGFGELKTVNNSTYTGFFSNGKAMGYGKEIYQDGSFYTGEFQNGLRNGFGMYTWNSDGQYYIGQWKDGKQHGYGYFKKGTEVLQAGYYENAKQTRNMLTQNYKNKQAVGNCIGDCANGFGYYKYSNNDSYVGFFTNSKRNYVGAYTWASGNVFIGEINYDLFNGQGIEYYKSAETTYYGEFVSGKRHGKGAYFAKNGTPISKGYWENGVLKTSY